MSSINIPDYGARSWQAPVATAALLPAYDNYIGDARITTDTNILYVWTGSAWVSPSAAGYVSSVGLTDSTNIFNITNSPITTAGNLNIASTKSQAANTVFAAPDGVSGPSTFRALVNGDIPNISAAKITSGQSTLSTSTTGVSVTGTNNLLSPGTIDIQTASGSQPGLLSAADWNTFNNKLSPGSSGIVRSVNSVSSPTTAGAALSTDYVYFVSGTTTLTLPTAVSNTNRYSIKNSGSNTVTVATTSGQTIDGSASATLTPNTSLDLVSNNSNWFVI